MVDKNKRWHPVFGSATSYFLPCFCYMPFDVLFYFYTISRDNNNEGWMRNITGDNFIRVECEGRVLSYTDGVFNGDIEMSEAALFAIENKMIAGLWGVYVECGFDTVLGVLGAMTMFNPSKTVVLKMPNSAVDELSSIMPDVFINSAIPSTPVNIQTIPLVV